MAHLGLTPQSVNAFGGYKVQGKDELSARKLIKEALAVQKAGAFAVTLECVPSKLAALVTKILDIPTIGIGAGNECDGQVLVYADMLGMFSNYTPKFAKHFGEIGTAMKEAFTAYINETKSGSFPAKEHTYKIDEEIISSLEEEFLND
jgi:3-methyl-2-oxobutanoate hydroxymethyltransferase